MKRIMAILLCFCMIAFVMTACQTDYDKKDSDSKNSISDKDDEYANDNDDDEVDISINDSDDTSLVQANSTPIDIYGFTVSRLEEFDSTNIHAIELPSSGLIEVSMSSEDLDDSGKFNVSLKDSDDTTLWYDSFYAGGENKSLFRNRMGEGTYYLVISGDHTEVATEEYTISALFIDESEEEYIEHEWNNTQESANLVTLGVEYSASLNTNTDQFEDGDIDYFCISLAEEKVLKLDLRIPNYNNNAEYELSGKFGNYSLDGGLGSLYEDFYECHTKTVRLEPGDYYFNFSAEGSVPFDSSVEYYFTVTEE